MIDNCKVCNKQEELFPNRIDSNKVFCKRCLELLELVDYNVETINRLIEYKTFWELMESKDNRDWMRDVRSRT